MYFFIINMFSTLKNYLFKKLSVLENDISLGIF
ncbi:hypothetical protein CCAND95_380005 [Capnocytophaga canis]|nr:hypothetical protein CCAND95_380005 [Capnocytophaga canis]